MVVGGQLAFDLGYVYVELNVIQAERVVILVLVLSLDNHLLRKKRLALLHSLIKVSILVNTATNLHIIKRHLDDGAHLGTLKSFIQETFDDSLIPDQRGHLSCLSLGVTPQTRLQNRA